ncbi:hypothetical protein BRPE64_ECDS02710 (plasmid) [Caballeronia insecticola]|uniref:Uncharacterized protein n=1 Tax=Caballeronia insecticola TaxID=758793 RepID=A0A060PJQ4_9BURK|nr:hypothetical protein BRPE64_ECDS02710 [Caballeronia insecticola]
MINPSMTSRKRLCALLDTMAQDSNASRGYPGGPARGLVRDAA